MIPERIILTAPRVLPLPGRKNCGTITRYDSHTSVILHASRGPLACKLPPLSVETDRLLPRYMEGRIMLVSTLLSFFGAAVSIVVCLEFIRPLRKDNPFSA